MCQCNRAANIFFLKKKVPSLCQLKWLGDGLKAVCVWTFVGPREGMAQLGCEHAERMVVSRGTYLTASYDLYRASRSV